MNNFKQLLSFLVLSMGIIFAGTTFLPGGNANAAEEGHEICDSYFDYPIPYCHGLPTTCMCEIVVTP